MDLAPYAMEADATRGRRHKEETHPYRSEYQRDRDRVVHTKAFRRLERKTQVFETGYSDHFRNRLTHTLEVSQISRTIGQQLGLNQDLCEVLALSHDIGHPPFSHEGERVLDQLMQMHGSGFEHNIHALRIVEHFEERYASFRGLNLTFEVREGIIKHSRDYEPGDKTYVDISQYCLGLKPPLEAQLIDIADEIAYNAADIDDGCSAGLLSLEQLLSVPLIRRCHDQARQRYPDVDKELLVSETIRRFIDVSVTDLIRSTQSELERHRVLSVDDVRQCPKRMVRFGPQIQSANREVKEFLRSQLYEHDALRNARERARQTIELLFEHYLRKPESLPPAHLALLSHLDPPRVVCDYIAGMTDHYALLKSGEVTEAA